MLVCRYACSACLHLCVCVCMSVCVYIYMFVCVSACIHVQLACMEGEVDLAAFCHK